MVCHSRCSFAGSLFEVIKKILSSAGVSSVRVGSMSRVYNEAIAGTFFRSYFGGRLPFLRYYSSKIYYYLGGYRKERNVNWQCVKRLVFVCKGNINRSPFAEYYCKSISSSAVSLGLDTDTGLPASDQALANAMRRNICLSTHKTCRLSDFSVQDGDLFVVFESSQADSLRATVSGSGAQITLIGLWAKNICPYIQDPICREDSYFQACYSRIEKGVEGILERLEKSGNSNTMKAPGQSE